MKILIITTLITVVANSTQSKEFEWHSTTPLDSETSEKIERWLEHGVLKTKELFARLPQKKIYFSVTARNRANEPVPWGQVSRDGWNTITLDIDRRATFSELANDWTIYHEIAHLYHPFLDQKSTWLSEGFASYIQNVTMLNANVYSKNTFIQKLHAGFNRGKKNSQKVKGSINNVSSNMRKNRAYMRVYWTGAAFFLEADIKLQQQGSNLVTVFSKYTHCCLSEQAKGQALIHSLDTASGTNIFSQLYARYIISTSFPVIHRNSIEQSADYYLTEFKH